MGITEEECGQIDSTISFGKVPKDLEGTICKNEFMQISKNEFCFHIIGVAHYYVANGSTIVVEPEVMCNENELRLYLLGTSFGIILIQRNIVAIHGGAVVVDGRGIILTGDSGAGKSTLTAAFIQEGYRFLADDVSAIGENADKSYMVHPAYPQKKLCRDAMEIMGYDVNMYSKIDECRDKYAIPLNECFINNSIQLDSIFEITLGTNNIIDINEIFGIEKLNTFLRNIYRKELYALIGTEPEYFKHCLDMAKNVRIFKITRPENVFSVNKQMELIINTLQTKDDYFDKYNERELNLL